MNLGSSIHAKTVNCDEIFVGGVALQQGAQGGPGPPGPEGPQGPPGDSVTLSGVVQNPIGSLTAGQDLTGVDLASLLTAMLQLQVPNGPSQVVYRNGVAVTPTVGTGASASGLASTALV